MKRKILKTLVLLLAAVLPLMLQAVNTIVHTANYDVSLVTLGTDTLGGVTYTTVNYDGLYNGGNPGAPSLPVDYIRFSVPYNATNFTVSATLSNSMVGNIPHLVYPCQRPRMMEDTVPWSITLPDSSIYNSGSFYPANNAWVVNEGFLAGENHIVTVAVMPISFRYTKNGHLTTRQLRKSQSVNLTLSYELSDTPNIYPLVRKDSLLRQEGHKFTRGMVVNPDSVITFAPPQSFGYVFPTRTQPLDSLFIVTDSILYDSTTLNLPTFPYLIVTTPELKHSLRRIAALKRQKGYGVSLLTTDYIYNHYVSSNGDYVNMPDGSYVQSDSCDEGKIRRFLKHAYLLNDTKYLLLAGKDIPYRSQKTIIPKDNKIDTVFIPTDWYYSDLNSNIMTGELDYEPEIFPGRIMARTPEEINNYTDKLFRYELNPGRGDFSYLKKALLVEGRDFKNFYLRIKNGLYNCLGISSSVIIEVQDSCYPKGCDVINSLNFNNVGFISIFNHGSPTSTKVYGSSDDNHQLGPQYFIYNQYQENDTCSGLNYLNNKNSPAIFYSPSCETINYDYLGTTFGEAFITGKDYGGPIYIGNTNSVSMPIAQTIEDSFILFTKKGYKEIGKVDALSKNYGTQEEYGRLTHNLLGDPLLEMWTSVPEHYNNITVSRTDDSVTIAGIVEDLTIVAYYDNDGKIGKKTINPGSITLTGISPNSTIMLYKHNYIPFIAPLMLQNVTLNRSQYVIATDVTAGNSIDSIRTPGDVTIPVGVEYEIEASGIVRLEDGFKVEKGATFAVYPSSF